MQRPRTFSSNGTAGMVIVPAERMGEVLRVRVDGEQVWPEADEPDVSEEIERLEELVGRIG